MSTPATTAATSLPGAGPGSPRSAALEIARARIGYEHRIVCDDVNFSVPRGGFTAIIGPNACGKSTLLRAVARILPYEAGSITLEGREISKIPTKQLATRLGLLPQSSLSPDGIRVADLVARGRYPHQSMFDRWSAADERIVVDAMSATGVGELSGRLVDELSGGQRQRVWVAMVLAQQTPVLLLDEPTTFLDITHQFGLLELFETLRQQLDRTIVTVLHDLNQAARYASHLIVMKDGGVVTAGPPAEILTAELIDEVYELPCRIMADPETGAPMVIPKADLTRQPRGSSAPHTKE